MRNFKEQFVPVFSQQMKQIGFGGAGYRYAMEAKAFLFVFRVEVNKHGQVSLMFGIQPKAITEMGNFKKHNFKKIVPEDCELTRQLIPSLKKPFWNAGSYQTENEKLAHDVFAFIHTNVLPIIIKYVNNPDLFDKVDPSDIEDEALLRGKLFGMYPAGMPTRTAWMLAKYYESKNAALAKPFAQFGLESIGNPTVTITKELKALLKAGLVSGSVFGGDQDDDSFFGLADLKRIAAG